ncbi:MAG: hypothetical protein NTY53_03270 [Kiritimatiellaeota bacterium]|nr:hypothetical protein [Kiritimatiellota bacterium]
MKTRTARASWLLPCTSLLVLASVCAYVASGDDHEGRKKHGSSSVKLPPAATKTISYTNDVKPIFSDMCFGCHAGTRRRRFCPSSKRTTAPAANSSA